MVYSSIYPYMTSLSLNVLNLLIYLHFNCNLKTKILNKKRRCTTYV